MNGAALSLWRFNYENGPSEESWNALGYVGIGMGDLGATPVMRSAAFRNPIGGVFLLEPA